MEDIDPGARPHIAALTEKATLVRSDRPLMPMTRWLLGSMIACLDSGRNLQLLTPSNSRLTMPLASFLVAAGNSWVVHDRDTDQYYDGFSGLVLTWRDGAFEPVADSADGVAPVSEQFRPPLPPAGRQLRLCFEVQHAASRWTRLCGAIETLCCAFAGAPPAGWGTAEPVTELWRPSELTAFARDRVPTHCGVILVGEGERPCIGTLEVTRTADGVSETVELAFGYSSPEQPPLDRLAATIDALASEFHLAWLYAETRFARPDLTLPAHLEGLPIPLGVAIGPEGASPAGVHTRSTAPMAQPIGRPERPTVWYELSAGDSLDGWAALSTVMRTFG